MFHRTSIYALAAVAALGVTALATSSASARAGAGGPVGMHGQPHGPMGVSVKPHGPMGVSFKPTVQGIIIHPKKPPVLVGIFINPKLPHHHPHQWCKWHYCGPNWVPVVGASVAVGAVSTGVVAAAPAATCTCLTKTYLQDGSVLFKDVCTTELAIAAPGQKASAN